MRRRTRRDLTPEEDRRADAYALAFLLLAMLAALAACGPFLPPPC